ncbi:MAG: hypothetical protein JSW28_07435, partial [Thermoplasmata archaeon]
PGGSLRLKFAVVEDHKVEDGDYVDVHRYAMRDILTEDLLPGSLGNGDWHNATRSFPIDFAYNPENIGIVAFVQVGAAGAVLQSALYDFLPQSILVVDDDQSTNPVGYEDDFQEVLMFMGFSFDTWVVKDLGSPDASVLAPYEVVIWACSNTSSNTLTASDQTAISTYLDSNKGSLFISGQDIGQEIGGTTFYTDYLHATYVTNDVNEVEIKGIAQDPISEPWIGGKLTISNDSPSEIAPVFPATATFLYSVSNDVAAVKAEHDVDSRVVYMACMYFESTDMIDAKFQVMDAIINWLRDLQYRMMLSPGYNLISVPNTQWDTSVHSVLGSIDGQWNRISTFNNTQADHWKMNNTQKPEYMNDLDAINHHMGFWVHVTTPSDTVYIYPGAEPWMDETIHLYIGWNLVGYPSQKNNNRTNGLNNLVHGTHVRIIWSFNAATQQWEEMGPSDEFVLGRGYFIYSNFEQDWIVPSQSM